MRILIILYILLCYIPVLAQSRFSNRLLHRFSFAGDGLLGTGTKIQELTAGSVTKNTMPGFAVTAEYSVLIDGLTGGIGLGLQSLPAGVKYRLPQELFNLSEKRDDFEARIAEYGVILFYLPVKLGYTFGKMNRWQPSIQAGINLYIQNSYSISQTRSYTDPANGRLPVSRFTVRSPHSGGRQLMPTYTVTARMTRILPNHNQILVGLLADFSNKTLYTGSFSAVYQNGLQVADYRDNGSFIGLQLGYALFRK